MTEGNISPRKGRGLNRRGTGRTHRAGILRQNGPVVGNFAPALDQSTFKASVAGLLGESSLIRESSNAANQLELFGIPRLCCSQARSHVKRRDVPIMIWFATRHMFNRPSYAFHMQASRQASRQAHRLRQDSSQGILHRDPCLNDMPRIPHEQCEPAIQMQAVDTPKTATSIHLTTQLDRAFRRSRNRHA